MQRQGMVRLAPGPDGRERIVAPTRALNAILPRLEQHWAATNAAAAELEAELPHPLAATLHAAVEALDRRSFAERARATFVPEAPGATEEVPDRRRSANTRRFFYCR